MFEKPIMTKTFIVKVNALYITQLHLAIVKDFEIELDIAYTGEYVTLKYPHTSEKIRVKFKVRSFLYYLFFCVKAWEILYIHIVVYMNIKKEFYIDIVLDYCQQRQKVKFKNG